MLLKMPLQLHQSYLTLMSASPPAYPQTLAAMALASYCNKTLQAHGTLFRQAHVSSLTLNPDMQSSNLKCWLSAGLSLNAGCS